MQRILWDCGLHFGFSARPLVVQDRNVHEYIKDFAAEQDLYMKSQQLVTFLGKWKSSASTLPERIQELWIALYEHDYIEEKDVFMIQSWLSVLARSGYEFPEVVSDHVMVTAYLKASKKSTDDKTNCEPSSKSLTFWTADLHDGTRMDVPTTLATQNHKVTLGGIKRSVPHKHVSKFQGISIYNNLSSVIRSYNTHSTRLTESMVTKNYEFYKGYRDIAKTDAFICQFPASMCEMWMPINKSIVFAPAHRYNLGRCTEAEWNRLNEHLYMLASSPRHIIGAQSLYDKEYLEHYTGLKVAPLYSYSGYYTSHVKFNPIREEILVVAHVDVKRFMKQIKRFRLATLKSVYKHYELSDLGHHRAIVYFPYSVMSYKLTEYYSLKIPLFMPSMKYLHAHPFGKDRSSLSSFYCKNYSLDHMMKPHPSSAHMYSPNFNEKEAEFYWLQLSDFFYWPHITYFDDAADLEWKLKQANFQAIHDNMVKEMEKKRMFVSENWCKVVKRIPTGRSVPQNYHNALQTLYNVSRPHIR